MLFFFFTFSLKYSWPINTYTKHYHTLAVFLSLSHFYATHTCSLFTKFWLQTIIKILSNFFYHQSLSIEKSHKTNDNHHKHTYTTLWLWWCCCSSSIFLFFFGSTLQQRIVMVNYFFFWYTHKFSHSFNWFCCCCCTKTKQSEKKLFWIKFLHFKKIIYQYTFVGLGNVDAMFFKSY